MTTNETVDGTVLAVAGAKGGVGKTTTSINLAAALARRGCSVVAVELDLAMANVVDFLAFDRGEPTVTMHDVLAGEAAALDAVYRRGGGFAVAPSGTDLDGFAEADLDRLEDVVSAYRACFDVVVLDTGAGVSRETIEPMKLADATVLVTTPRVAAVRDADKTRSLTERVDTDLAGLVLTNSGTGASPGADRIAEFLDVELLGHVPEDDAVPASQDHGEPVVDREPHSGAAHAYRLIAEMLLGVTIPLEAAEGRNGSRAASGRRRNTERTATVSDGGTNRLTRGNRPTETKRDAEDDRTGAEESSADERMDPSEQAEEEGWVFGRDAAGDD